MDTMKKGLRLLLCASLVVTLVGCGNDKKEEDKKEDKKTEEKANVNGQILNCSISEGADTISAKMDFVFNYDEKGEELKTANFTYDLTMTEELMDEIEDDQVSDMCEQFDASVVKSCSANKHDTTITTKVEYDVDKIKDIEDEPPFDANASIEDLKEILETDNDFTCKISK